MTTESISSPKHSNPTIQAALNHSAANHTGTLPIRIHCTTRADSVWLIIDVLVYKKGWNRQRDRGRNILVFDNGQNPIDICVYGVMLAEVPRGMCSKSMPCCGVAQLAVQSESDTCAGCGHHPHPATGWGKGVKEWAGMVREGMLA